MRKYDPELAHIYRQFDRVPAQAAGAAIMAAFVVGVPVLLALILWRVW